MLALDNHFHHCGLLLRLTGRCGRQPQTRAQQLGSAPQGDGDEGKQSDNVRAVDTQARRVEKTIESKRFRRLWVSPVGTPVEAAVVRVSATMAMRVTVDSHIVREPHPNTANDTDNGRRTTDHGT